MTIASIFSSFYPAEQNWILTQPANAEVASVHTRMPLILQPAEIDEWLHSSSENWIPQNLQAGLLEAYPVSSLVSRPGVETSAWIVPLVPETSQSELF